MTTISNLSAGTYLVWADVEMIAQSGTAAVDCSLWNNSANLDPKASSRIVADDQSFFSAEISGAASVASGSNFHVSCAADASGNEAGVAVTITALKVDQLN